MIEFVSGVLTKVSFWFSWSLFRLLASPPVRLLWRRGIAGGKKDDPCVLSSSLQCGDQWREYTELFSGMVWMGVGERVEIDVKLQICILPSGAVDPVARRSGFHGHQAIA